MAAHRLGKGRGVRRLAAVRILGVALIVLGAIILLEAFARFVLEGLGTPAPVAPTEHLVVGGLYRYVGNPMYLAVGAIIVGQGLVLGQPVLFLSAAGFALAVAAFVHWYEERWRHDVRGCEASRQVRGCPRR